MNSIQLSELATALAAAQGEFIAIPKDSANPFFKSKYASLAKVVEVASPILSKHGLAVSQFISVTESGNDTLTTWLMHSSGQYIADTMRLHLVKDDPQGQGSAVTYARRYSYMSVLGLVADEDDDGNKGSTQSGAKPEWKKPVPQTSKRPAPAQRSDVDTETGEISGDNLQGLMLSEIKDKDDRTSFFGEMTKRNIRLNAVPKDKVAEVEELIGQWATGRPF